MSNNNPELSDAVDELDMAILDLQKLRGKLVQMDINQESAKSHEDEKNYLRSEIEDLKHTCTDFASIVHELYDACEKLREELGTQVCIQTEHGSILRNAKRNSSTRDWL